MNLNKVILIGRLTRDPENRTLPSGQQVTSFGLATDRFYTDKSGQKQKQTEFHNITLFGRLAQTASQYLNKGALAMIEGRLRTSSWQDHSGNKKFKTEIVAEGLQLGPKKQGMNPSPEGGEPRPDESGREEIPIIEEEPEGEIDVKDIPL